MIAYRLLQAHHVGMATIGHTEMFTRLHALPIGDKGGYNITTLVADMLEFKRLMRLLDWDGTKSGDVRCFYVPSPHALHVGFFQASGSSREAFIGVPFPMHWLEADALDIVDTQAVERTKAKMQGQEWTEGEPIEHRGWSTSKKGNLWTIINGTNCVVLSEGNRYVGLLRGNDTNVIKTRYFNTEKEAADYIERNYRQLIIPWTKGQTRYEDAEPLNLDDPITQDVQPEVDDEDFNLS
jgi:hypothetical protein